MSFLTPKRDEASPTTTRLETSLGYSMMSPTRLAKLDTSIIKHSCRMALEDGASWKMFVLPEFKEKGLGDSMSTIHSPEPTKKYVESRIQSAKEHELTLTRSETFGMTSKIPKTPISTCEEMQERSRQLEDPQGIRYLREEAQYLRIQFLSSLKRHHNKE